MNDGNWASIGDVLHAEAKLLAAGGAERIVLATKFTMQEAFYLDILRDNGLDPIVPNTTEQDVTNDIIFDELCKNIATAESEAVYLDILNRLQAQGADSVI
jgi:aspartate racemase